MKTVANQFAETFAPVGTEQIYNIVGDSLNGLTYVDRRQAKIEWAHVRHEEMVALAGGAEAHLTGELGISRIRPTNPADVNDGIADALAQDCPVLIDAAIARIELAVLPPSLTPRNGGGLFALLGARNH